MPSNTLRRQDTVLSGGSGTPLESARNGYLPINIERVPVVCFSGLPIYLRAGDGPTKEKFTLYCRESVAIKPEQIARLEGQGVQFVYTPISLQARFRQQIEANLINVIADRAISVAVKSELIYEAAVELVNEFLRDSNLDRNIERIEKISRALTTLVLNEPSSFCHLFTASHHEFYTATHMVNVAMWMVPLALARGHRQLEELNHICQAGLLHDIGKMNIPSEILNARGKLSAAQWKLMQMHPRAGSELLSKVPGIDPLVCRVTLEHHERADGSGYPQGLRGQQMHPISRIIAVVDSFDAMTAFRPFKRGTMSADDALELIVAQTPEKYDAAVVKAWIELLCAAEQIRPQRSDGDDKRRQYPRFPINCPARVFILDSNGTETDEVGLAAMAHNISRSGIGLLSKHRIRPGEHMEIRLQGNGSLERREQGMSVRCREYRDGWYEVAVHYGRVEAEAGTGAACQSSQ